MDLAEGPGCSRGPDFPRRRLQLWMPFSSCTFASGSYNLWGWNFFILTLLKLIFINNTFQTKIWRSSAKFHGVTCNWVTPLHVTWLSCHGGAIRDRFPRGADEAKRAELVTPSCMMWLMQWVTPECMALQLLASLGAQKYNPFSHISLFVLISKWSSKFLKLDRYNI